MVCSQLPDKDDQRLNKERYCAGPDIKKKKREELAGDVQVRGSTVCTDREIVVFRILRGGDHRPALQEIRFQLLHVEKITACQINAIQSCGEDESGTAG